MGWLFAFGLFDGLREWKWYGQFLQSITMTNHPTEVGMNQDDRTSHMLNVFDPRPKTTEVLDSEFFHANCYCLEKSYESL